MTNARRSLDGGGVHYLPRAVMMGRIPTWIVCVLIALPLHALAEPGRPDRESPEALLDPNRSPRDSSETAESSKEQSPEPDAGGAQDEARGLFRDYLHGRDGLVVEYVYTGEVFNNARGGMTTRNAAAYRGNLDLTMKADLQTLGFAPGGTFFVYAENGHGRGVTRYVGDYQIISNIDAPDFMQVSEYWYERGFFDSRLTVRAGKQDCNVEFSVVDLGGDFVHSSFGAMPAIPMPTFPVPSWAGVALLKLNEHWTFKTGVWDGQPRLENWGLSGSGVTFTIAEIKAKYEFEGSGQAKKLPGDFHVGLWYHSGRWEELGRPQQIESLEAPQSDRIAPMARLFGFGDSYPALQHGENSSLADGPTVAGNYGAYAGAEQMIFNENDREKDEQGLGVFFQFGWAPKDRNLVTQYYGAGLVYRGLVPSRDEDHFGLGVARAVFTEALPGLAPETAIEMFYKAKLSRWASLQPDLQYVASPGGVYRDALVVGLRFELAL